MIDMTFQFRIHENGGVCCASTNDRGEQVPSEHPCPKCVEHFAAQGLSLDTHNYAPPDSYGPGLAQLRAAAAPLSTFEQRYRQSRQAEFDATRRTLDAYALLPRLTTAEVAAIATYAPPDAYKADLDKLREQRR